MISALRETPFEGTPAPYPASCRVNADWSTIISPMRTQFIERAEFENRPAECLPCEKLYFPFEGEKVEYSGFWMQPTQLDFAAEVGLTAPESGEYSFLLAAFGGVKVYVNGALCHTMFSYLRNQEQKMTLRIPLREGRNTLYIQCNDLAERDTMVGFRLRYDGDAPLTCDLPAEIDSQELQRVRSVLSGAYLDRFNYFTPDITVHLSQPVTEEMTLDAALQFADAHIPSDFRRKTVVLHPGDDSFSMGDLVDRSVGLVKILLTARVGGCSVSQALQLEYYDPHSMDEMRSADIETRRRNALRFLATHGTPDFQNALAILETGADEERARTIIDQELDRINRRFDCSDFRMPAVFYALKSAHVPEDIKQRLRECILNFRYWFDEPGTDVMWFFSENHALCFHTCELLAGEFFPQRIFSNSGMTGDEHRRKAKRLLTAWFDNFMRWGFSEWNSAVYIPIDVIGMIALYDMTIDPEIRRAAKLALDKTFDILARNSFRGVVAASYGRIYFKNLIGRRTSESSALNFILSGEGWLNQHCFAPVLLALSRYQPDEALLSLYDAPPQGILNESVQGEAQAHLYSYKTPDYILATVLDYRPGQPGLQEHVIQLMIRNCDTQIWINHPGEAVFFGEGRPSYFAGNGTLPRVTQHENRAQLVFDLLDQEVSYTHAYCPLAQFDTWALDGNVLYARKDSVWVALYAENGLTITEGGPLNHVELRSPGRHNVWRVFVQTLTADTPMQTFVSMVKDAINHPEIWT